MNNNTIITVLLLSYYIIRIMLLYYYVFAFELIQLTFKTSMTTIHIWLSEASHRAGSQTISVWSVLMSVVGQFCPYVCSGTALSSCLQWDSSVLMSVVGQLCHHVCSGTSQTVLLWLFLHVQLMTGLTVQIEISLQHSR